MKENTAIVILNYKNYSDTINCINSILDNEKSDYVIIVVDNDSKNDSLKYIEESFKGVVPVKHFTDAASVTPDDVILLVDNSVNSGYAAGNNKGLRIGSDLNFKYLVVLNNDTLFFEECFSKFKKVLNNNPTAICVGPLLLKGDRTSIDYNCAKRRPELLDIFKLSYFGRWLKTESWRTNFYYLKKYPNLDHAIDVDIISGSCMFFDAEKFKEIDFFDENTFLYYEEAIINEKARKKGYKMMLEPNAKVIHLGAQTTKSQSTSIFTLKCEHDSLKIYLNKYRNTSKLKSSMVLFVNVLFIYAYTLKNKLK